MRTRTRYAVSRRHVLAGITASAVGLIRSGRSVPAEPAILKRKSIDALSAQELENYKFAVNVLKERGIANPGRPDGYAYQAALHNRARRHPDNSVGACEHGSEQFFPWHRAHLAGFEKLLQQVDLQRTANVTIPYWDWTRPPSGRLFPHAFEDTVSPLFHNGRVTDGDPPMWDADDVRGMVRDPDWDLFAGRPKGPDQSYGSVEDGPHNAMHGAIGPTMGDPRTASQDPIYWSFHAGIDLIWARWQRLNQQSFGCGTCKLWLEPDSYSVDQMASTTTLRYEYDYNFSPDGAPVMAVASRGTSSPLPMLDVGERSVSAQLTTPPAGDRKLLKIEKVRPLEDATYRMHIYLHPANVKPADMPEDQRRQYLVRTVTIWQSFGHHPEASDVIVDIGPALARQGDANRVVSVLVQGVASGGTGPMVDTLPPARTLFKGLATEGR